MTGIIFSFDTEDFTDEHAADGILEMAEILRSEGVRGSFGIAGYVAKQLLAWGRTDILSALRNHEIDSHTLRHSYHPTIGEYTNTEDFRTAYNEVIREESEGFALVKAATGVTQLYGVYPPGEEKSYAAMYAYGDLGIPLYCDTYADTADGRGVHFCNQFHMKYFIDIEDITAEGIAEDEDFYDELANRRYAIIFFHPNKFIRSEFWDGVNYMGKNLHKYGEWQMPNENTEEWKEKIRQSTRAFIRGLRADGRFEFLTYEDVARENCQGVRILKPDDIPEIRRQLTENFYPLSKPYSLCISDIFRAAVSFLRGDKLFACGRVYGFLDAPYAVTEPVKVTASDVREAAKRLYIDEIDDLQGFIPTSIDVGGIKLGPADFLFAMLDALCGMNEITVTPREQNISLHEFPDLANPPILNWPIRYPGYTGEYLIRRLPLQAWTIRF